MKNYNFRQIHPWRFQIDLYEDDFYLGSFIAWNADWPEVSLGLMDSGYVFKTRKYTITIENNYYGYMIHNFY